MAQPAAAGDAATSAPEPGYLPEEEVRSNAQSAAQLTDYLRRYTPSGGSGAPDTFQERYRIDLSTPLTEFDSKTARAYAAIDLMEPSRLLMAQICQPGTIQRSRAIQLLKPISHPSILSLVAAGAVALSRPQEERFVIFYERPAGKKLSELLAQREDPISQQFICEHIIAPLANGINQFSELDISHGLINPDNIYFKETAVLGPCLSEPCGYSQPFYFEPLERMQALPAGKGEGSAAQDYYALAVVVLYILHGPKHFSNFTENSLARAILKEGVYGALTRHRDVPEVFYDFFRGMLSQTAEDRWNYRYLKPWLDGKRYNVLPPPPPIEAVRPFEFGDAQANTRRELAHLFATGWEHMHVPIQKNQLTQWVAVSLRNKELAENVTRISKTVAELGSKNEMQLNEQLMRIILLLDPIGPIRIKQVSMHIDGIDTLFAEFYAAKAHQELQLLAKFIELNMASYWTERQRRNDPEYVIPPTINTVLSRLDRLRSSIRNTGQGFGLERILYDLNPDMSCLSPLFATSYVTSLSDVLRTLDRLSANLSKDDPLDRHLAAFIASKLNIQHEIRLHELSAVSELASSRIMIALHLLAQAQRKVGNIHLPGLTHWLALRILPLMDNIHSRTLRQKLKAMLMERAELGSITSVADLVITSDYATADQNGFQQARSVYQLNAAKIEAYRTGELVDIESARVGFIMAKIMAYAALIFSIIGCLRGTF